MQFLEKKMFFLLILDAVIQIKHFFFTKFTKKKLRYALIWKILWLPLLREIHDKNIK